SRGSALEEVAGDAATLVNPLDTRSIADGIESILDNPRKAEAQRQKGFERSQLFSWDLTAARTLEFYRKVLAVHLSYTRPERHRRAGACRASHGDGTVPAQPAARVDARRRRPPGGLFQR